MTFDQIAIICLLIGMFGIYALERFRVEVVALTGLAIAFGLGLVPMTKLFAGFSSPAVVTVVEILLIVTVLARTHVVERFARMIARRAHGERAVLAVLCSTGALVSVSMNNIGALALMFPVTLSVCARLGIAPGRMLMPLSFATLLGGLCSLTGTPANLIVNEWRVAQTGGGFGYFELGLVGAPVAAVGICWMVFVAPKLFRNIGVAATVPADVGPSLFAYELQIPPGSKLAGLSLLAAERANDVEIHDVVRAAAHVFARRESIELMEGDILLAEGAPEHVDALLDAGDVTLASPGDGDAERLDVVVMPDSILLGSRVGAIDSFAEHRVSIMAVASRRRRFEGRFADLQLGLGDVLMLSGNRSGLAEAAADAAVLPLSFRGTFRRHPEALRSVLIFVAGIIATASGLAPPEIAFGGVVVTLALTGGLKLRSALQDMNWPIIILLACMIPLGMAVQDTGAARVIANAIMAYLPSTDPTIVTLTVLLIAVGITPFVDNVSVAAVLSPIAAGIASRAGVPIEPLLAAVAIGASLDFMTPFGHHNNTVVMGAAGYRFVDFPRLGAPLLGICVIVAICGIRLVWL